jgi:hypothetical protein
MIFEQGAYRLKLRNVTAWATLLRSASIFRVTSLQTPIILTSFQWLWMMRRVLGFSLTEGNYFLLWNPRIHYCVQNSCTKFWTLSCVLHVCNLILISWIIIVIYRTLLQPPVAQAPGHLQPTPCNYRGCWGPTVRYKCRWISARIRSEHRVHSVLLRHGTAEISSALSVHVEDGPQYRAAAPNKH